MSDKTKEAVAGEFKLKNVRLSFPKLFVAEAVKATASEPNPKKRYGAVFMIDKATGKETYEAINAYIEVLKKQPPLKGKKLKSEAICLQDGDDDDQDENYRGHWIISANRNEKTKGGALNPPTVVDRDRTPLRAEDGKPYGGCYVDAIIRLYVPAEWAKVCASLEGVQFRKDGTPFGSGKLAPDAFDDISDEEEEEEEEI